MSLDNVEIPQDHKDSSTNDLTEPMNFALFAATTTDIPSNPRVEFSVETLLLNRPLHPCLVETSPQTQQPQQIAPRKYQREQTSKPAQTDKSKQERMFPKRKPSSFSVPIHS